MILKELLKDLPILKTEGDLNQEVDEIECLETYDFQEKGPFPVGNQILYVHFGPLHPEFMEEFIKNKVHILVLDRFIPVPKGITLIQVISTYQAYAQLCSRLAKNPSKDLTLIGVTGTNGKTTTTLLLDAILREEGFDSALFGSLHYRIKENLIQKDEDYVSLIPPFGRDFQALLNQAKVNNVSHVILEVSGQGLREHRLDGLDFDIGVITNITPEHMDYHLDMKSYFEAKSSFFTHVLFASQKKKVFACINQNDERGEKIFQKIQDSHLQKIGFGKKTGKNIQIYCKTFSVTEEGIQAKVVTPQGILNLHSSLLGDFNLMNILAAISASFALGISKNSIERGIQKCTRIPGRLEKIPNDLGIKMYFDWAHTVESYRRIFQLLREWNKKGKFLALFGCENAMDTEKRVETTQIAAQYADELFLTLEDLTPEQGDHVKGEMEMGLKGSPTPHQWFSNVRQAVLSCLQKAQPGDTVLFIGGDVDRVDELKNYLQNS